MSGMNLNGFLSKQLSKIVKKAIKNKLGFDPDIDINTLNFYEGDDCLIHLEVKAITTHKALERFIEEVTK